MGIPEATFHRIVKHDIRWHPYLMHVRDLPRKLGFFRWFLQKCTDNRFLPNFLIGDEVSFCMNGKVNSQNVRKYAPKWEPPNFNFEKSDSRKKLKVWTSFCGNGAFHWSIIFDGNVNGANYLQMLNEYVLSYLFQLLGNQLQDGFFQRLWWTQDGAPGHRAYVTAWLAEIFGEKVIALYREVDWSPRIPDITNVTFFSAGTWRRESTKHHPAVWINCANGFPLKKGRIL